MPKHVGSLIVGTGLSRTYYEVDQGPDVPSAEDDEFRGTVLDPKWTPAGINITYALNGQGILIATPTITSPLPGRQLKQPIPAGAEWRLRAKCNWSQVVAANSSYVGVFCQVGAGRMVEIKLGWNAGLCICTFRWLTLGAFFANVASFNVADSGLDARGIGPRWVWFEIRLEAGTLHFSCSFNGTDFFETHTETIAAFLTVPPTQFGLKFDKIATVPTATRITLLVDWFRASTDLTEILNGREITVQLLPNPAP
ncbi:MAG: hypothetical protein GY906_38605 [bacterium]|nr:hypothetical protein [bacterium]